MRRLASRAGLLGIITFVTVVSAGLAAPSGAQEGAPTSGGGSPPDASIPAAPTPEELAEAGVIEIVPVTGLIDPVLADFIIGVIEQAEKNGSRGVVLQMDSEGSVLSDEDFAVLARRIRDARVPVSVWVGPSGGAKGAAAELVAVARTSGMAVNTSLGKVGEQRLPTDEFGVLFGDAADRLEDEVIDDLAALELGVITVFDVPEGDDREFVRTSVLGDFLVNLDEVDIRIDNSGPQPRRLPVTVGRFANMGLLDELLHTVASPEVAYLLFAIGMVLLIFELYTAGIGIAGAVGAVCFLLGSYGLNVLPTNWFGILLLVLAMFAFTVDVQTGVPFVWTWIGLALFAVGSFTLYDELAMSWVTLLVAGVGIALTFIAGMPSMVRTRFSTPHIARDWLIGEEGEVVTAADPEGTVSVRSALWAARSVGGSPLQPGTLVRVASLDGVVLEVEPLQNAAR